jgi:PadR family transcriptional regulator, regulatory protein PadR
MSKTTELLQGTLDLLILKAISLGPLHGYGVLLRLQQLSGDALQIPQGSLYPALYRLEHQGLVTFVWGESENKRQAKYYTLTAAGRKRLREETDYWERLSGAIGLVLKTSPSDL